MTAHLGNGFGPLEMDALPGAVRAAAEKHLADCDRCASEYRQLNEALELFALDLVPEAPPPALWKRIERSIRQGRFAAFAGQAAAILDLSAARAAQLLDQIDDEARWEPGPADGVTLLHIEGGPRVAAAVAGFVRVEAGSVFPRHTHLGAETVLLLQGSLESDTGSTGRRGDVLRMPPRSTHEVRALPGPPLLYLAVVDDGVELPGGQIIRPGDPRL
jgi:anti-sigma factor ChrR (cupin superfamily)